MDVVRNLEGQVRAAVGPIDAQVLIVADARDTDPFDDTIAQQLLSTMLMLNARVERAGILVGGRPLYAVQLESLLLATRHPNERTFREVDDLIAFAGTTASDEERRRMVQFFAQWQEDHPSALPAH